MFCFITFHKMRALTLPLTNRAAKMRKRFGFRSSCLATSCIRYWLVVRLFPFRLSFRAWALSSRGCCTEHNQSRMQPSHGSRFLCRNRSLLDDGPQCSVQPVQVRRAPHQRGQYPCSVRSICRHICTESATARSTEDMRECQTVKTAIIK